MKFAFIFCACAVAISIIAYLMIGKSIGIPITEDGKASVSNSGSALVSLEEISLLKAPIIRVLPRTFNKQVARTELIRILKIHIAVERSRALSDLFQKWMQLDPYDALSHIDTSFPEDTSDVLYTVALTVWSQDNSVAFDDWLKNNEPHERYINALISIVLDDNTPEVLAIDWVDYIADLESSESSRQKVLDRWVINDPQGIVRWGMTTIKGRRLLTEVFQTMTRENPESTFITLALLEGEKQSLVTHILSAIRGYLKPELVTQGVMLAIQTLPDQVRSLTVRMMMPHFSQWDNPGEIGDMINALPDDYYRIVMMEGLAYAWARRDPQSAAQFVLTIPKGEQQSQAVAGVVSQWHMQDLPAASEWLNSVRSDDVETDKAAHHLASHAAQQPQHVGIAAEWVERIKDPELKKTTTQDVVANWFAHDEKNAEEFLREQNIFSEEKLQWFLNDQKVNKDLIAEQERLFYERKQK